MQQIKNIIALDEEEINYRISAMTEIQREILSYIVQGQSDNDIAKNLNFNVPVLRARLMNAADRTGCKNRAMLICLYSVWRYAQENKPPG